MFEVDKIKDIDPECIALCNAMNKMPAILTVSSCCGHGNDVFCIFFNADNLEALPPLLYFFDSCHCGCYGWRVYAHTDCAMSPVSFCAESTSRGEKAYREAKIIAHYIEKYVEKEIINNQSKGLPCRNYIGRQT